MVIRSDLYGHSIVWHNLVNDYLTNHLSHAYIFAGSRGIGKALTAKEYIKYIINANDTISERIDEGSFLDLLYISKQDKNEIGIDAIRSAGEFFMHTASEGKYKFVIIDSADDLNLNAANALLKILEEPRKNTFLFLISYAPYRLFATIRSRCRMVRFSPLKTQDLKLITSTISSLEDFIAGSAQRALKADYILKLYEQILELVQNYDIVEFNKFADQMHKNTEQWQIVQELVIYLLNRVVKFLSNALAKENMTDFESIVITNFANKKSIEEWYKIYNEFCELIKQTEIYNLDKKQVLLQTINRIRN